MAASTSRYDTEAIRERMKRMGSRRDPDEFRPDKAEGEKTIKYRFYFLPPLLKGDATKTGPCEFDMDQFFLQHGAHWMNKSPVECPRVHLNEGADCRICQFGFDLFALDENKGDSQAVKAKRQALVRAWMPGTSYMTNIYFPDLPENPEELRGKVRYFNAPQTVIDHCKQCIMADGAGDPVDPQAFGVFYDEYNAYLYQLEVKKQGDSNSYKTSKFLAHHRGPIVAQKDGKPFEDAIKAIMAHRINLFSKLDTPTVEAIDQRFAKMMGDDDGGGNSGFDANATKTVIENTPPPAATRSTTKAAAPVTKAAAPVTKAAAQTTKAPARQTQASPILNTVPVGDVVDDDPPTANGSEDDNDVAELLKRLEG